MSQSLPMSRRTTLEPRKTSTHRSARCPSNAARHDATLLTALRRSTKAARARRRRVRLRRHAVDARQLHALPEADRRVTAIGSALTAGTISCGARGRKAWRRDEIKAELIRRLFTGRNAATMDVLARGYADDVVRSYLRADTVEKADWHRTQGHELVIVSASLGMYLRPIAERLRFDAVLCTDLEVGADGLLTGEARRRERARSGEGAAARRVARRADRLRVGVRRQLGRPHAVGTRRQGRARRSPRMAPRPSIPRESQ